jgi:hypothetical protein
MFEDRDIAKTILIMYTSVIWRALITQHIVQSALISLLKEAGMMYMLILAMIYVQSVGTK